MNDTERTVHPLLLLFALVGGATAWTLQLWLGWVLGEPACFLQRGQFTLFGLDTLALWLVLSLLTGLLALLALGASYRLVRHSPAGAERSRDGQGGRRRFLLYVGLLLNGLFLLTIVMGATSVWFLEPCS